MEINGFSIDVQREGATAKLRVQGSPIGVAINLTLSQLETLALYLANEVGKWRDERTHAEELSAHPAQL